MATGDLLNVGAIGKKQAFPKGCFGGGWGAVVSSALAAQKICDLEERRFSIRNRDGLSLTVPHRTR